MAAHSTTTSSVFSSEGGLIYSAVLGQERMDSMKVGQA